MAHATQRGRGAAEAAETDHAALEEQLDGQGMLPGAQDPHLGGVHDAGKEPGISGGVVGKVRSRACPHGRSSWPQPGQPSIRRVRAILAAVVSKTSIIVHPARMTRPSPPHQGQLVLQHATLRRPAQPGTARSPGTGTWPTPGPAALAPDRRSLAPRVAHRHGAAANEPAWPGITIGVPGAATASRHGNPERLSTVSYGWVNDRLGLPASAVRQDRIIDEIIAASGDLRRICDLFGVTIATAQHYTMRAQPPRPGRLRRRS